MWILSAKNQDFIINQLDGDKIITKIEYNNFFCDITNFFSLDERLIIKKCNLMSKNAFNICNGSGLKKVLNSIDELAISL